MNRKKDVELAAMLIDLAELKLDSNHITETVEKGRVWPAELVSCFLNAWQNVNNEEKRNALIQARHYLPVSEATPALQDELALLEIKLAQREKETGLFQPVLDWPIPPQQKEISPRHVPSYIQQPPLNGRDPFAFEYAEDELYDLFTGEKDIAFWGGHPLFNALFAIDRVTLVYSPSGNGQTALAYGLHYFATRREVFALHIPGTPAIHEIQRRFIEHLFDFVLAYPSYLRRTTAAEMELFVQLLASQMDKTVIMGRIQARQADLSTQFKEPDKPDNVSSLTQLQMLLKKLTEMTLSRKDTPDWLIDGGISTVIRALGFKRAILILEANEIEQAQTMMDELLSQTIKWQTGGLYTVFFLPEEVSRETRHGDFYRRQFVWSFSQLERMISWRYRSFVSSRHTVLELFENKDVFHYMLQQCVNDDKRLLNYSPRKFIQLWHNIIVDLSGDSPITRSVIDEHITKGKTFFQSTDKDAIESVQTREQVDSSLTVSDSAPGAPSRELLHRILANYFDLSELRVICFFLNVNYDEFSFESKSEFIIKMIAYFERTNRKDELWRVVQEQRPNLPEFEQH